VQHSAKKLVFLKKSLPSAALGKEICFFKKKFFTECHTQQRKKFKNLCRVPESSTRQTCFFLNKFSLLSAFAIAIGKVGKPEFPSSQLCQVQWSMHSAKVA
jgi:hypothetical protein